MILLLMGVSGCGKSTVGAALARSLRWPFFDADDFHPPANVAKMAAGEPLTDADRWPWLDRLADEMRAILARGGQDGAAAQQAAAGARALGVVVGTRYIHTVTEMIDRTDLAAARDILAAWVPTLG